MRITFVLPNWSSKPIGGYKVVYEYANHLVIRGHRVYVVHPLLLFPQEVHLKQKVKFYLRSAKYLVMKIKKLKWFRISREVRLLIVPNLREKYIPHGDVIVATAWQTAEWVNSYGMEKGKKFYLIQGYEVWGDSDEKRVKATWRMPLRKIAISKWLKDQIEQVVGEAIDYIPNGLNFKRFYLLNPVRNRDPKIIGMIYYPPRVDWKRSRDGVKALQIAKERFPELKAVFFSTCPKEKDVPDWIEFVHNPRQEEILKIYNRCSIFVSPCHNEGWSLPPAESLACGCALVTTDSKGVREYAIHEKTALISEAENPQGLADNILRFLSDNELRIRLAKQGNDYIKQFTWDKSVKKMERLLKQAQGLI